MMRLLRFGAMFDWITPAWVLGHSLFRREAAFHVDRRCGMTGKQLVDLLHRHGIRTWGHMPDLRGQIRFAVPRHQAVRARQILEQHGLPITLMPHDAGDNRIPIAKPQAQRLQLRRTRTCPSCGSVMLSSRNCTQCGGPRNEPSI